MKWFSIRRAAAHAVAAGDSESKTDSAEIWIYADIGESWWGDSVTAKDFVKEVAALDVSELTVRINSYGGSVADGIAIYNALKRHKAKVTVSIDGIAASIASLIAMAGDQVEIAANALIMLHAPWGYAGGNAVDMRNYADLLDKWAQSMASSYASKTGKSVEDVMAWLTDGTDHWFSADEAVAEGLADLKTEAVPVEASATRFDWRRQDANANQRPAAARAAARKPAAVAATTLENPMDEDTKAAAEKEIAAKARAEEAKRQTDIRAYFGQFPADNKDVQALLTASLADTGCSLDAAKAKLCDVIAKGIEPVAGHRVVKTEDEEDKARAAMRAALEIRAGLVKNDTANPWRARSLLQYAERCLIQAGVREADIPGDKLALVAMAFTHSTSDFPNILANVANKSMMKGYTTAPETWSKWCNRGSLPDFKQARSVDLGSIGSLRQVRPGAEFKYVTFGERAEVYALSTYGELFGINRQTIINDDLDAFSKIPTKMGAAAARTIGDLAYAQLTANANLADGGALFNNTAVTTAGGHANLQAAAAIATASVDAMRVAMAIQRDIGQTSGALNLDLAILLTPKALEGAALTLKSSQYAVTSGAAGTRNNTEPNSQQNRFEVVSDARLDADSTSKWYGLCDPAMGDTVTVFFLDGNDSPFLDEQQGWSRDGVEFKVRIDAAAKAMDFRGMQRNG